MAYSIARKRVEDPARATGKPSHCNAGGCIAGWPTQSHPKEREGDRKALASQRAGAVWRDESLNREKRGDASDAVNPSVTAKAVPPPFTQGRLFRAPRGNCIAGRPTQSHPKEREGDRKALALQRAGAVWRDDLLNRDRRSARATGKPSHSNTRGGCMKESQLNREETGRTPLVLVGLPSDNVLGTRHPPRSTRELYGVTAPSIARKRVEDPARKRVEDPEGPEDPAENGT